MYSTAQMNPRRAEGTIENSNFERAAASNVDMKVADSDFDPEEVWDTTKLQYFKSAENLTPLSHCDPQNRNGALLPLQS
jgi:hypothetical protein